MSISSVASGASVYRGYDYYTLKKVVSLTKINEEEYEGRVKGNAPETYHVKINIPHARRSACDCPHAKRTRIVCKHMVALYFAAFPEKAEKYIAELEEAEREEERQIEQHYAEVEAYVMGLTKKEITEKVNLGTFGVGRDQTAILITRRDKMLLQGA